MAKLQSVQPANDFTCDNTYEGTPNKSAKKFVRLKDSEILAYNVDEFCFLMGIGRSTFYGLINDGSLKTVMLRGRRLVPASEAVRLLEGEPHQSVITQK